MHKLIKKFETNFDIEYNRQLSGINFDFAGEFNQRSVKYMFFKAAEVYAFKSQEYVFYKDIDYEFNIENIQNIKTILQENVNKIVKIDEEHMSSVITFIFSSIKNPNLEVQNVIKKFKFYKSFKLGFKGWVNIKLIIINPNSGEVYTNKYARGNEKFFKN